MSKVLQGLEPQRVFHYFEEICAIPHGSGNEKAISDYCVAFARSHGLWVRQDEANNVIIRKKASKGYENAPVTMLQGHLDMVCEKNNDVAFDFENEGLKLKVDGDSVSASGTTLGGDDGIAVAYALAILEDDTLEHPELEIVLTTDEEVGMKGTHALDVSDLKAACLINLDNECEGQILTACAGGMKNRGAFPVRFVEWEGLSGMLCIRGLKGGHSGAEIHCGRANANRLLGRLLFELNKALNVGVSELSGGMKDNAIPREAQAKIVIRPEDKKRFSEIVSEFEKNITDGFDPIRVPKAGEREIKALQDDEVMIMLDAVTNGTYGTYFIHVYAVPERRPDDEHGASGTGREFPESRCHPDRYGKQQSSLFMAGSKQQKESEISSE